MSNTRTLLGIRKLVLIDSAGYDLGVFPIDAPLSVSGENNVGKSSAINALQFLFLSNIQHMYFGGYSNEDTRKYYFPRETSFALMEVILETGTYVVGAAGKGVAAGHGYQHFAYQGQFDFADYQEDDGTLRRLPEVMRAVHIKGARVHKFSPEELRQALMGQPTASNLEIGMVELRDASEKSYRTFNDLFKNLIHMKAVKGPQLKKLLISVFGNRLTTSQSVDYASAYQGARSAVNSLEDKLDVLLKIEPDVQRFTQYHQERLSLAGKLKAMMAGIETGIQAWDGSFKAETERLRTALGQTAGQISEIDRKNRESSDRIGKLAVEESTLNTWLSRLADFEREFALVRIDEVKARIEHQRAEYRKKLAVVSAANRPVPAISREMAQNQQAIARLERRLASLDANFFGLLQQVASHEELVLLLKLFQEGFLSVPVGTEGVQVSGAGSVRDFVDQVLGRCRDGCYREGGIAVNLAGLKSPSVKEFVDKDLLLEELSDRRARAATLAEEMDAAINSEAQQAQISRMEAALHDDEAFLRRHEEYQAMLKEREAKRLAFDKARQELAELKAFQQEAMGKTSALKDQEAQLGQSLRQLQAKNDSIGRKMAQLKRIDEAEESHPFAGEMPSDLESLADAYSNAFYRFEAAKRDVATARRAIELVGGSRYLLNTDTESLKKLQEEYENKANLIDLIRKTKSSQITQLGSILKSLREDYERLRVEMGKFNRTINKQTISNLTKLEIRLVPVDRLLSIIIRLVNASEMDLFADTSSQDNDAHELFEHVCKTGGSLELTDLFNINIVVQGPDGQEKAYNDLDTVASNGTTITAKALISMHLMNYLMKGRRQPVRIPYYLDEAADIDISNQRILIDQGLAMGFVPVLASVSAQENARYCVHLGDGKSSGRLYVDENDWFIIQENYAPGANLFGEAA